MTANVFHFHGCGTVTIRTAPSRNRNTAHVAAGADNAHAGLPGLAEAQREQALARWQVLRAHLEDGCPLVRVAGEHGVPERTLRRWLAAYRAGGLAALARRPRSDRGTRRMPPDLQLLIEGLALRRPPPTIATVHRQAAEVARAQGWPAPGYAAVYDVVQSIDPAMATLAHEGSKRYKEVFDLVHRREAAKPNEILLRCSPAHRPALPLDPVRMFLKGQSAPEYLLLTQVAQTGKSHPGAQRAQPRQEAADRVRPADRHDHDPLRLEIPAAAHRGRFQCDLVADALDEHHGHGVVDLRQGAGRRPGRGGRATHVAIERPAGKLTAIGGIHGGFPVRL